MGVRVFLCTTPMARMFSGGTGSSSHISLYFSTARDRSIAACAVVPVAIDGQADLWAHGGAGGGYERGHMLNFGCTEVAIVLVGFVRRGDINVKLQIAKTAGHHFRGAAGV